MRLLTEHVANVNINRMPIHRRLWATRRRIRGKAIALAILLTLFIFIPCLLAESGRPIWKSGTPVVVIDPGHGGNDVGAKGPEGTLEKNVTLDLARLLADQLTSGYQVVLTRSDDYQLQLPERTAVANRSEADIFISLHTGGSFINSISGSAVYFYQQFTESALAAEDPTPKPSTDSSLPMRWDQIQIKYRTSSEKLAKLIQHEIDGIRRSAGTKVQGAPLLVLEGADMPAVAIEIGNLSNPSEEKMMQDPEFLARIARAIAMAVEAFFTQKPK
jgi:N-acetylmuramoyl-L-alanine amidase